MPLDEIDDAVALGTVQFWAEIQDRYDAIIRFIEWCESEYDIRLDFDYVENHKPAPLQISKLVDKFFEIDRGALEHGRHLILEQQRKANDDKP